MACSCQVEIAQLLRYVAMFFFADTVSPQTGTSAMATHGAAQQENDITGAAAFNFQPTVYLSQTNGLS